MGSCTSDYRNECSYYHRKEKITGVDDLRTGGIHGPFQVEDSILYRLYAALDLLQSYDTTGGDDDTGAGGVDDDWSWDQYCYHNGESFANGVVLTFTPGYSGTVARATDMSLIRWEKLVMAGWSQGAGHSVLIGLENELSGMVMLDGPADSCDNTSGAQSGAATAPRVLSGYYKAITSGSWASDAAGKFGAWHEGSPSGLRPGSWVELGLPQSLDQDWDLEVATAEPGGPQSGLPALASATLATNQNHPMVADCSPHSSMALGTPGTDASSMSGGCMPTDATGGVQAMAPQEAHLFEAYVAGFCAAGD